MHPSFDSIFAPGSPKIQILKGKFQASFLIIRLSFWEHPHRNLNTKMMWRNTNWSGNSSLIQNKLKKNLNFLFHGFWQHSIFNNQLPPLSLLPVEVGTDKEWPFTRFCHTELIIVRIGKVRLLNEIYSWFRLEEWCQYFNWKFIVEGSEWEC